jgi:hypothetical protein
LEAAFTVCGTRYAVPFFKANQNRSIGLEARQIELFFLSTTTKSDDIAHRETATIYNEIENKRNDLPARF